MANELALIEGKNAVEVFSTPNGLDSIIDKIEASVKGEYRDVSTEEGRANIRSTAFKLAKDKKEIERMAKTLTEGWREQTKIVNTERDRGVERMQKLQDEIRAPLTEWEQAEEKRVNDREERIAQIQALGQFSMDEEENVDIYNQRLEKLTDLQEFDWQEFKTRAADLVKYTADRLEKLKADRIKSDAEKAELDRLRKEEEARLQKERDERIAAEAAEKAKKEAEEKAAEDARIAKEKADKDRREAEENAENERKAKEKAMQEAADADARAKKAEEDRIAAEKKAEEDRKAAAEKAEQDKKEAEEKARQDERNRAAAAKKKEDDEAAARAADKAHKAKINNEALAAIIQAAAIDNYNIPPASAQAIVVAIAKGEIPNVTIKY